MSEPTSHSGCGHLDDSERARWERYPAYRDSGIEWLGEVPEHWESKRLKYVASINDQALPENTQPDYEIAYVDISGVDAVAGITSVKEMVFEDAPSRARRVVRDGDTIVSTVRTYLRAIARVVGPSPNLIVSTGFAVVRPRSIDPGYLSYALRDSRFIESIVARSVGVSYPGVNASDVGTIPVLLPSPNEQRDIADFLDRETAEIDGLVTKKRELIQLLQEKRSALISQAVTKGLDPSAPVKDSGIEWLGEVPEHWDVRRLKFLGLIRYGLGEPPEYADDGLPFIRATDINRGRIDLDAVKRVSPDDVPWSRDPMLRLHEILVVRSGAYTGDSALVTEEVAGCIAGYDMVITTRRADARFLAWVLLAKYMLQGQIHVERLRAAQPHLNAEELGSFVVLTPPLPEQRAIADFLDPETAKLDQMTAKVEEAVERLQEYRSALITAAVTGKIDVRGADVRASF